MKSNRNIYQCLLSVKKQQSNAEDKIIQETKKILNDDLFSEKNILHNLGKYKALENLVDEESVNEAFLFNTEAIFKTAVDYRLKFLDSAYYRSELPYELVLKIKHLEQSQQKALTQFKILASPKAFKGNDGDSAMALFAKTNHDNYYLIHQWGKNLTWKDKLKHWPLRNFETLAVCLMAVTFIEGLLIPNSFIIRDPEADYWNGYRGGNFFHLLIINVGFTAYFFITFAKNFSENLWNRKNNLD